MRNAESSPSKPRPRQQHAPEDLRRGGRAPTTAGAGGRGAVASQVKPAMAFGWRHKPGSLRVKPNASGSPRAPGALLAAFALCAFLVASWQMAGVRVGGQHGLPLAKLLPPRDRDPAASVDLSHRPGVPAVYDPAAALEPPPALEDPRPDEHPAVSMTTATGGAAASTEEEDRAEATLPEQHMPRNLSNLLEWDTSEAALELLHNYTAMHRTMIQEKTRRPRALVVHFHSDTGMANRMGVLISALALAIATDRALLMEWPPVVAHWHPAREYIALPAVEQLLEPPPGISWRWSDSRGLFPPGGGCHGKHATASNCLDLQNPQSAHFGALLCKELDTAAPDPRFGVPASGDVLHLQSWDFFLPLVKFNPSIAPRLAPLGPDPAPTLARWLLRPAAPLEQQARSLFLRDLAGHFVVGMHVRMQGYNGISAEQVKHLAECAYRLVADKLHGPQPVVFFLASDSRQGLAVVSSFAMEKNVKLVHMDSPLDSTQWRGSVGGTQAALVELRILAMCDELVISPGSTFGRAAHMWSSKHAHVLLGGLKSKGPICVTKRVTEACCHSWKNAIVEPEPAYVRTKLAFREPKLPKDAWACLGPANLAYLERNHGDCANT